MELVALIDPGPSAADVAAKVVPSVPFFKTVTDMLTTKGERKSQVAIVCVPNNLHVQVVEEFCCC
jgi:predicted dehydrogenase